jgi:hypothetical protein
LFLKVIADSVTETLEALATTSIYFIYVGTVVFAHLYQKHQKSLSSKAKQTPLDGILTKVDRQEMRMADESQDDPDDDMPVKTLFPIEDETEQLIRGPSVHDLAFDSADCKID